MHFVVTNGKISAFSDDDSWAGEVSFSAVTAGSNHVVVERVFVVPAFRGHGLATRLMDHFVQQARDHQWTVKIMCPYAKHYFKLHPKAQSVLLS
ncbi:GNAT family N-acetyltransferase [uncultured Limosilactobacillus sp.]|uniref:GNAT family N-acetyltransferase n=1 Tax=uncultured Limosilactobacillus sp. TaxID=2837629 RepID=UPI0025D84075|nr:GNAT family N-acetyltransferase [uncultured Limosilactobacillus sp.]